MKKYEGFDLKDTFEINSWFLNIMPKMLTVLQENNKGYPLRFHKEYYEMIKDELDGVDEFIFTSTPGESLPENIRKKQEEMKKYSWDKWNSILLKMIYLFNEAKSDALELRTAYHRKCAQDALELFKEYFEDLWW